MTTSSTGRTANLKARITPANRALVDQYAVDQGVTIAAAVDDLLTVAFAELAARAQAFNLYIGGPKSGQIEPAE